MKLIIDVYTTEFGLYARIRAEGVAARSLCCSHLVDALSFTEAKARAKREHRDFCMKKLDTLDTGTEHV